MDNKKYLFITHRTYDNGKIKFAGIDQIINFLKNKQVFLIEHPIESNYYFSVLKSVVNEKRRILKEKKIWPRRDPWCWIVEALYNFIWAKKIIRQENISKIFAVTALNIVSILPLKLFNKNLKIYLFLADYSDKRFNQWFLDIIYRSLNKISFKFADKILVVSQRIHNHLSKLYPDKVIFVPNSPFFDKKPLAIESKSKFSLVFCAGRLTERVDLNKMFSTIQKLKNKYPAIRLNIIGKKNSRVEQLINKYEIKNNIIIHDFLTHQQTLNIVFQSYIGVSWYSAKVSHLFWGDSLKIREYAKAGLPTASDNLTSTADEMEANGAGIIINSVDEMVEAISKLIEDNNFYLQLRLNALKWAKQVSENKITILKQLI